MLCFATPYTPETLPMKMGAFTLFSSIVGITLAPLVTIAGGCVITGCKAGLHMDCCSLPPTYLVYSHTHSFLSHHVHTNIKKMDKFKKLTTETPPRQRLSPVSYIRKL